MGWREKLAAAGVRINEDAPDGWDPDEVYLAGYRKGRRAEAADRDPDAATFEEDKDRNRDDDDSSGWPDAARWSPGGDR